MGGCQRDYSATHAGSLLRTLSASELRQSQLNPLAWTYILCYVTLDDGIPVRILQMTPAMKATRALHRRLHIEPFADRFACRYLAGRTGCRGSLREKWGRNVKVLCGDWPYIGAEYGEATVSGRSARIVVVGMDGGGQKQMDLRFSRRQQDWYDGFKGRDGTWHNAHVAGTNLAIRELVDDEDPESYLHQFCYINSVKCTPEVEGMSSKVTPVTRANCTNHLQSELNELKPDLIVIEGRYPETMITHIYRLSVRAYEDDEDEFPVRLYSESDKPLVLALPHPSARPIRHSILAGQLPSCYEKGIGQAKRCLAKRSA